MRFFFSIATFVIVLLSSMPAFAVAGVTDFTSHGAAYGALAVFIIAYGFVFAEETLHLRKSKPVMIGAGFIWVIVTTIYAQAGRTDEAVSLLRHNLLEYAELFLFLLAAMAYINTMIERNVFQALRARLMRANLSLYGLFWVTGIVAFLLSPVADNLTTALVMGTVVLAVGGGNKKFIVPSCINVVVAANAGGAFSPFGDITTLMIWQKGVVAFTEFFALVVPSVVNWLVPALLLSFAIPKGKPAGASEAVIVKRGGFVVIGMFLATIVFTVLSFHMLKIPPFLGMMTGFGFLKLFGYFIRRRELQSYAVDQPVEDASFAPDNKLFKPAEKPFDIFISTKRAEWDTLLFFYGIILCVGGLGALGYLAVMSDALYVNMGPTTANILIGLLSAVVDNIPLTFAVLSMNPTMDLGQWLLITLTAGCGGSLLSIGSAAGVALMGTARGTYTFFAHLKWTWAIALGYAASIATHMVLNAHLFTN